MPTNCMDWKIKIDGMLDGPEKVRLLDEWSAYCTVKSQAIDDEDASIMAEDPSS